uniref:Sm domain-containing protein n=1 Tax=Physcomitrium patens TaxID=3218 RepID=A0A2K1KW95_PHYPA|nr:hypothetical protein PHYPA_005062 [Physcomitrium patens]
MITSPYLFPLKEWGGSNVGEHQIRNGKILSSHLTSSNRIFILMFTWPLAKWFGAVGCSASDHFISGRKETVLDLAKFVDRGVSVKLSDVNHLAVTGTLKGYDQLLNLVLDEASESSRGTAAVLIASTDGTEEITNPLLQNEIPAATA